MEAKQTPLIERLESVPQNARCRVDEPDGMGSVFIPVGKLCHEAADALRVALAEPVQEPVAWMTHGKDPLPLFHKTKAGAEAWGAEPQPLYTAPPQRKPLMQEEIDKIFKHLCNTVGASYETMARAVERAHGIKE